MPDLPKPTADTLARIARDGHLSRRPTYAHPDCTCLTDQPRARTCPVHYPASERGDR